MPRVVRLQWTGCGENDGWHGDIDEHYRDIEVTDQDIKLFSQNELPMALWLCPDSRRAVLPYYPFCFASSTRPAATRFNGNIDTLYVDSWIVACLPILFDNMSDVEHSRIKYLAISDDLPGMFRYSNTSEFCQWLDPELAKFSSLKEICIAISPVYDVQSQDPAIQRMIEYDQSVSWDPEHTMELFQSFPQELVDRYELRPDEVPTLDCSPNFSARPRASWRLSLQDWVVAWAVQHNLKFVWWMERDSDNKLNVWYLEQET